jgi:hypothetical protein
VANGTSADRTSTTTTTTSVETTDNSAANTTNNSADGDEATFRNLRIRFQELLRRRHQILRNIVQQTGEVCILVLPQLFLIHFISVSKPLRIGRFVQLAFGHHFCSDPILRHRIYGMPFPRFLPFPLLRCDSFQTVFFAN